VEGRILPDQEDIERIKRHCLLAQNRKMRALLIRYLNGAPARLHAPALIRDIGGVEHKEIMPAALRLQHQSEGGIPRNMDALEGIHLNSKLHATLSGQPLCRFFYAPRRLPSSARWTIEAPGISVWSISQAAWRIRCASRCLTPIKPIRSLF